jgi:transposase
MVSITAELNAEVLRQVAALQEQEIHLLRMRVRQLCRQIAQLEGDPKLAPQLELSILTDLEQMKPPTPGTTKEKPAPVSGPAKERKPQTGHGPCPQPSVPVVEEIVPLLEEQGCCTVCGGTITEMQGQYEESEEVTVIERQFVRKLIKRAKGRCACNASVVTAPLPPRLIPGGRYSIDFAIEVAMQKYLFHMPLERQARSMGQDGLTVTSQALWDQIAALAGHLRPSFEAIWDRQLAEPVLHVDETRWPDLSGKRETNWSVLSATSPSAACYRILGSKSERSIRSALAGYEGTLVADGYSVYEALARDGPGLRLANCWAHVLRKFREIEGNFPVQCGEILGLIGDLYAIERKAEGGGAFPGDAEAQQRRAHLRNAESRPLLEKIRTWALSQGGLRRSELGKAIRYTLKRWEGLSRFLEDPLVPLDNNAVERALRGPVVGRKNHYGSKSKRGTEVAALFYTLCETAKLCGVEVRGYLREAAKRAISTPGAVLCPADLRD